MTVFFMTVLGGYVSTSIIKHSQKFSIIEKKTFYEGEINFLLIYKE